jgi:predicted GNAT superfamily acetyltransferase
MPSPYDKERYHLHILETPEAMEEVEALQRLIWPGNETDIVPGHLLLTSAHNGGLLVGAYDTQSQQLVGFVFGFPGLYETPDGLRLKHCSHMLGVHPEYRDQGLGFVLKRAQWQMVRHQGIRSITWTYDPLLSRNAHLNIHRLGAICNTYIREAYGEMRDGLNVGLPSDRFQVDWWVDSARVVRRLSKSPRARLDLAHFLSAETPILNPSQIGPGDQACPAPESAILHDPNPDELPVVLVEIPADFLALKAADIQLGLAWRLHTRALLESLFKLGYLVTDFVYLPGRFARSFYALSYGESTLPGVIRHKNIEM